MELPNGLPSCQAFRLTDCFNKHTTCLVFGVQITALWQGASICKTLSTESLVFVPIGEKLAFQHNRDICQAKHFCQISLCVRVQSQCGGALFRDVLLPHCNAFSCKIVGSSTVRLSIRRPESCVKGISFRRKTAALQTWQFVKGSMRQEMRNVYDEFPLQHVIFPLQVWSLVPSSFCRNLNLPSRFLCKCKIALN